MRCSKGTRCVCECDVNDGGSVYLCRLPYYSSLLNYFIFYTNFISISWSLAPFQRPNTLSPRQSRYFGVIKADVNKNEFAVEFPVLNIEKCSEDPFRLPQCCTTGGGKVVILKTGIDKEYYAGQIYAFVIRILYGNEAIKSIHETFSSVEVLIRGKSF